MEALVPTSKPNQMTSAKNHLRVQTEANGLFQNFMKEAPKTSRNAEHLQQSLRFDQQLLFKLRNNIVKSQNSKAR